MVFKVLVRLKPGGLGVWGSVAYLGLSTVGAGNTSRIMFKQTRPMYEIEIISWHANYIDCETFANRLV